MKKNNSLLSIGYTSLNSLPFQGKEAAKGFTLVELIVVITILAILGTIAFISLQGYSKDARDSVRISDMSKIKTSLELFQLDAGKYPETTDDYFNVTYSGAIARTQGFFGETTFSNVEKLDKIPKDPLTDKKYIYSTTNTRQEFEIAGVMEGDEVSYNPLAPLSGGIDAIPQTKAGDKTAILKITGTYNGKILKVSTGSIDYVLAVPSIINGSGFTLEEIISSKYLAYNGYKNLPAQYDGGTYNVLGDPDITLVNSNDYVVFSGDIKNLSDTTSIGVDARKDLLTNLQSAYLGTDIVNIGEIAQIINTSITNTGAVEFLTMTFVNNDLGGNIVVTGDIGLEQTPTNSCNSTQPTNATLTTGTPTTPNQARQSANSSNPCYFTCNSLYGSTGTNCVSASTCGENGAVEITLTNGQTWSCMNLGATEVRNGSTQPDNCGGSETNCNAGLTRLGNYYQWGRNTTEWTDGQVASPYNYGWEPQNDTKWGGSTLDTTTLDGAGTTATGRQGPCPSGWHVPSVKDWQTACNTILGTTCTNGMAYNSLIATKLRLPFTGNRSRDNGYYSGQSTGANYWSSSPKSTNSYSLFFNTSNISPAFNFYRGLGFSVRCIKN